MDSILSMKFHGPSEPNDEDFVNARGKVGLDFMVDFGLSIAWREYFDDEVRSLEQILARGADRPFFSWHPHHIGNADTCRGGKDGGLSDSFTSQL